MRSALALALTVAVLAGCTGDAVKTVSHTGAVGQTLTGPGGLTVTPVRYAPHVRAGHDVSGLASPAPGTRLAAFLLRVCVATQYLPTISPQSFTLGLRGGGQAALKFPQTVYADDLDLLGEPGCERGHVVFQVPRGRRPEALRFALDWANSRIDGFNNRTHVRLAWTPLSAR